MLHHKRTYTEICEATGVSTATISRVNRCLEYGADGYQLVLKRLETPNLPSAAGLQVPEDHT